MPSCSSARGRLASITTSARRTSRRSAPRPPAVPKSKATERLRPFKRSKNAGGAAACAVGSRRRLHLDDRRARAGQQVAAQRPGPQRGQVDDQARPTPLDPVLRRAPPAPTASRARTAVARRRPPATRAARRGATTTSGSRSAKAASTAVQVAGAVAGRRSSSSHAGTASMSSSRGSETADPSVLRRQEAAAAPTADGAAAPQTHQRGTLAEERQGVQAGEGRPSRSSPSTRPSGGPSGSSGSPVSAIAPLDAQRCTAESDTEGRVTSRDSSS